MNKINAAISIILAMLMIATPLGVFTGIGAASEPAPDAPFAGGSGIVADPYIIENVWELQNMSLDLGANYSIINDIDASATSGWNSGSGFVPLGNDTARFSGTLNGAGHFITGLNINRPTSGYVGLFGYTNAGANIEGVNLLDYNITALDWVGGIAGSNSGNVTNCSAEGTLHGNNDDVGILIGINNGGIVRRSYSAGTVTADQRVGGLMGFNMGGGEVYDSYSTASVAGTSPVGGFIGWSAGPLTNCYSSGQVTGFGSVGGLLGINGDTVTNCFWDNESSNQTTSGGPETGLNTSMMMYNMTFITSGWDLNNTWYMENNHTRPFLRMEYSTTIRNSHQLQLMQMNLSADYTLANDIDLTGTMVPSDMWGTGPASGMGFSSVGGPVAIDRFKGSLEGSEYIIYNLFYNTTNHYNGILAYTDTGSSISNITVTTQGTVRGNTNNGILAGDVMGDLLNCHVVGSISGSDYTGGMTGYQSNGISNNCSARVNVTGTSPVGGYAGASDVNTINTLVSGYVYGTGNQVGGLVGEYWTGTINNSGFSGNVTGGDNTGGLVGYSGQGTITDCVADAEVNGATNVGGLIGQAWNSSITLCDSLGNTTGTLNNVGGLVGFNDGGNIVNCSAAGNTNGAGNNAGGLVGDNNGQIDNSSATCTVVSTGNFVGGLVGRNNANIKNSQSTGNTTGDWYVGGFAGYNYANITNSTSAGNARGTERVGGFAGQSFGPGTSIVNCNSTGNANGTANGIGGFIGYNYASIIDCDSNGEAWGDSWTGGFVGRNDGTIANCSSKGKVSGNVSSGHDSIGGFVGRNGGIINTSFTTSNVWGGQYVGGFVGQNILDINNCYAKGNVDGLPAHASDYMGGFVGQNTATSTITNCYSTGTVGGNSPIGGFCGENLNVITNSHWDNQTSGWTTSAGGIGNTTAEMMSQATFTNWDFTSIWGIYETNTYPFLVALGPTHVPQADLALTMSVSPSPIAQNGSYVYVYVNVTNNGPDNALNVNVTVTGSGAEMIFNSANQTIVQWASGASWYPPTLGPGQTAWLMVNLTANSSGMFYLNGTSQSDTNDPVPGNNNAGISVDINDAPIAVDDPNKIIDEDAGPISMDVLINDSDPDGDNITVIGVTQGQHGTVVITYSGKNATYSPDPDWNGKDYFNYTISDGRGGTATATVNITVNAIGDATVAVNDTYTIVEDSGANQLDVLANDYDVDGDAITVNGIQKNPAHGTVEIASDGLSVNYTPNADFSGTDSFNYTTTGGSGITNVATVNITVTPLNDAPVTQNDAVDMDEDTVATIDVLANDNDPDGDAMTIIAVIQPANCTVAIIDDGRNIAFRPDTDWFGSLNFTYTVSDGTLSTNGTVYVSVNAVNDPPVIHTASLPDGTVGEAYDFQLNITDVDDDVNSPEFTVTLQTNASGNFYVNSNLSIVGTPDTDGTFWVLVTVWDLDNSTSVNYTLTINPAGGTNTTTDSDGDGVPDDQDAFPNDPAASVDTDNDGLPDAWNDGYNATDSTTGLELDDDPTTPTETGGNSSWLYIIIILVIVGAVAGYMLMRGKGKGPEEPAADESVEEAPEEAPADIPEENEPSGK